MVNTVYKDECKKCNHKWHWGYCYPDDDDCECNNPSFELKCLQCDSIDCQVSIQMFDSCDIREYECNNCGASEDF